MANSPFLLGTQLGEECTLQWPHYVFLNRPPPMSYYFSPNPSIKYNTRYLSPVTVILSWFKPLISCCHKSSVGQFMFPLKKWVRQFANHDDLPLTIFCWPDGLLAQQFANLSVCRANSSSSKQCSLCSLCPYACSRLPGPHKELDLVKGKERAVCLGLGCHPLRGFACLAQSAT